MRELTGAHFERNKDNREPRPEIHYTPSGTSRVSQDRIIRLPLHKLGEYTLTRREYYEQLEAQ